LTEYLTLTNRRDSRGEGGKEKMSFILLSLLLHKSNFNDALQDVGSVEGGEKGKKRRRGVLSTSMFLLTFTFSPATNPQDLEKAAGRKKRERKEKGLFSFILLG